MTMPSAADGRGARPLAARVSVCRNRWGRLTGTPFCALWARIRLMVLVVMLRRVLRHRRRLRVLHGVCSLRCRTLGLRKFNVGVVGSSGTLSRTVRYCTSSPRRELARRGSLRHSLMLHWSRILLLPMAAWGMAARVLVRAMARAARARRVRRGTSWPTTWQLFLRVPADYSNLLLTWCVYLCVVIFPACMCHSRWRRRRTGDLVELQSSPLLVLVRRAR